MQLSTKVPLHPRQVHELKEERAQAERMLGQPDFARRQLDGNGEQVARRIRAIDSIIEDQAAKPIPAQELDQAVKAEAALREKFTNGMPTQAEMRRNPAGAVDKHIAWEKRNKKDILAWKRLRRELHASGISEHQLADENDVSNIEKYRPMGGSGELNMHNEQIAGKTFFGLETAAPAAVMSEEQSAILKELSPEVHGRMAFLTADQRAETLRLVDEVISLRAAETEAEAAEERPRYKDKREMAKARGKKKSESYKTSEVAALRARCKELGINTFGMSKASMTEAIQAKITLEGSAS